MPIVCGECGRTLEFSGEPPRFCAYCGQPLRSATPGAVTATFTAPAGTGSATVAAEEARTVGGEGADETSEAPPERVGGYRLVRKLGAGGMGDVFEGEDTATGERVAVKLISTRFARQARSLERFRQEGQLASLIAHPRCVFVLSADEELGRPYIVMELMPGTTLKDLVEERGPLAPAEAVAKILDVVEGLQEAHRLGIVHRDVKPSNCFLLPDGRVKVGDFGLSKSLTAENSLTQTGTFLGTVLYAAPEQIKSEGVDFAADVYAVAATLYFLLTGRAPFQHENAATALAKAISEDPTPPRVLRPEVPPALQRVVLKGLERDKSRRWQSLDEMYEALRALVPTAPTRGALGLRFAAYLIDTALLFFAGSAVSLLFVGLAVFTLHEVLEETTLLTEALALLLEFAYFAIAEAYFGCSLGKAALRLRVVSAAGSHTPHWPRVALRTTVFVAASHCGAVLMHFGATMAVVALSSLAVLVLLLGTMRARNGYRGLHELASGTRVVQLPWPRRRPRLHAKRTSFVAQPVAAGRFPSEFGPYHVTGVLAERNSEAVFVAEDPPLSRSLHIWVRPDAAGELPAARRSLSRPTRPRWLGHGLADGRRWDAFLAPAGGPLADLVAPGFGLAWTEAHAVLEQLTDELRAGRTDRTVPPVLGLDQVWVQPDGRVQVLDFALTDAPGHAEDEAARLALMRQAATLALAGEVRDRLAPPAPVRAIVPRHAAQLLNRLMGVSAPFANLDELHTALRETHDRPTEVTRPVRLAHLGVQAMFLAVGLIMMFVLPGLFNLMVVAKPGADFNDSANAALTWLDDEEFRRDLVRNLGRATREQLPAGWEQPGKLREIIQGTVQENGAAIARDLAAMNRVERFLFDLQQDEPSGHVAMERDDAAEVLGRVLRHPDRLSASAADRRREEQLVGVLIVSAIFPIGWICWAFLTRGGLTLRLTGLALVRSDGRPAARWQCAVRSLLTWLPAYGLLAACVCIKAYAPTRVLLASALWWAALAVVLASVVQAVWRPQRSLHDRIVGTHLVPL